MIARYRNTSRQYGIRDADQFFYWIGKFGLTMVWRICLIRIHFRVKFTGLLFSLSVVDWIKMLYTCSEGIFT